MHKSSILISIGGSVVECSPATRAARVRFPADAIFFLILQSYFDDFSILYDDTKFSCPLATLLSRRSLIKC